MNFIKKSLITIFIVLVIVPIILSLFLSEHTNASQPSLEGAQTISRDFSLRQYFYSSEDNLSGFGMSIKNPVFRNKKELIFELFDEQGQRVRNLTLNGANISDGDLLRIKFEPIAPSQNKKFSFSLSAPDADTSEALEAFITSNKAQWFDQLLINSTPSEFNISFNTYHSSGNVILNSLNIYLQFFMRLINDFPFGIGYLLLVGGLIGYLIKHKVN